MRTEKSCTNKGHFGHFGCVLGGLCPFLDWDVPKKVQNRQKWCMTKRCALENATQKRVILAILVVFWVT